MLIQVVTNPIRSVQSHATYANDPSWLALADTDVVKPALLYADRVVLEVVPALVGVEVAVPRLSPAVR